MSVHEEEALGNVGDGRLIRRLLGYLRPYKRQVATAIAASVAHAALQLAPPYLTKIVIDDHIATGQLAGLGRVALLFLLILLASLALEYFQTWTMNMTGQRVMFDLRTEMYEHLQRLDLRFYDRNPVGRLMTRLTSDVDVLNDVFTTGVVSIFGDVFTLAGILIVLVWMDWRLALIAVSVLPLVALIAHWFHGRVRESHRTVRVRIAEINAFLQERITGAATVQLFRRERRDAARFAEINRTHRDASRGVIFYYAAFYPLVEIVSALASALILWFGAGWVEQRTLTVGALVAFLLYAQRFFRPISDMSDRLNMLHGAIASSERMFQLLDTPVHVRSPPVPVRRPAGAPGRIAFEDVTFAYIDGAPVLRDVSFTVEPGQRVAIVGATGAGKTTIINLLLRFYDVQRGRITVDGVDVRDLDLPDLRALFGLVLQDVHLFAGTIASNVRLGDTRIGDAAVRRAVDAVHARAFIERLPLGLDAPVAERGATLSAGQKQLLSFARALAFDPHVLILDEATSNVDDDTELHIRDALAALMRGRTTIAIAHRLSTIQDMDRILVLHQGRLRESGTHQQLLELRGIYRRLYELQFRNGTTDALDPSEPGSLERPVPVAECRR